jgi:Zn-finger nucleic acid-binding protein
MKSSSEIAREQVQLELKYCERCGGLWLRRAASGEVYCSRCTPEMAELPAAICRPAKKRKLRAQPEGANLPSPRHHEDLDLEAMGGLV